MEGKQTLKAWIEQMADGEEIEAVVFGENSRFYIEDEDDSTPLGKVLPWNTALKYLTYEFNCGFGGTECHAIVAWTKTWVISVCQYDGATWPFRIYRNPTPCMPEMPGG